MSRQFIARPYMSICEVRALLKGTMGSALKGFWNLSLLPEHVPCLVCTGVQTKNPLLLRPVLNRMSYHHPCSAPLCRYVISNSSQCHYNATWKTRRKQHAKIRSERDLPTEQLEIRRPSNTALEVQLVRVMKGEFWDNKH